MADKGKKGKDAAPAAPPPGAKPPDKKDEKVEEKPPEKKVEPKDEVGTRKGCRRYKWELKDSNKEFWSMGHAMVKILSLGCLIGSLIMFTGSIVHPLLTLIITMEISIFSFLFVIYTFAIHRYLPFVLWPIADLLNDLFACIFLGGAVAFAVQTRQSIPMNYLVALILIALAGFFALIDVCLQRKHFKGKKVKRHVLVPPTKEGAKEPGQGPGAAKPKEEPKPADKKAEKPKEADKGKDKGKGGKK
ncbi:CKLF-like MARVEL transmembrane domain-containing protein 2 isoform X1 [Equus caballus]|uniref:CKLF like MARVEL transmembrane domain containing 2 n=1 Tax=Equus caballus TaxID=9796 RepID=F6TWG9_HORSE|nr:CKLF-like MARVEL transmembrane domain-containing protein 2 isoform X1 [Equus caballus]